MNIFFTKLYKHKFFIVILLLLLVLLLVWNIFFGSSSMFNFVFGQSSLSKTDGGRVNILILGLAGGSHDGATLTDTIITVSFDPKTNNVDLISLPRDLWLEEHNAKINTLYQTGLKSEQGLKFAKEEVGKILGLTIPYAVRVDFSGFTRAIDLVGGIDVEVSRSFDDYKYPIEGKEKDLCGYTEDEIEVNEEKSKQLNIPQGKQKIFKSPTGEIATDSANLNLPCRFEHISFEQGLVHMDGATALKFTRSRSGTNNEGTDFARSKRQQLILQSFRDRVLSIETLSNLKKINELAQAFDESVEADIPQNHYLEFSKMVRRIEKVTSVVIDAQGKDALLYNPPPAKYGAWVLIPEGNDFSRIHKYVDDILAGRLEATGSAQNIN